MLRTSLAAILAVGLFGGVANAQENDAERRYLGLQEAIAAVKSCYDIEFDQDQSNRLNTRVMELVGESIGPGTKLTLIRDARRTVDGLDGVGGSPDCTRPPLANLVGVYRQYLDEVVPLPAG